ncbi:nuclear protein [Gigaspora margarita]|uniref:Nuclear protein n=1 Tax=Gigaspora margarita TaxID=4874 RepID=A0A8H4ADT2_GIGMA|nr:nuclear protein [Gigaspora margarita]
MSSCKQRRHYVTKACTNCRRKHGKCTGKATCKYCAEHNLECIFIDSGKKRGPRKERRQRTEDRPLERNLILNGSEINFDRVFMQFAIRPTSSHTLTSPDNHNYIISYFDSYNGLQNIHTFQENDPFSLLNTY